MVITAELGPSNTAPPVRLLSVTVNFSDAPDGSDLEAVATHIAIIERGSIIRFSTTDAIHQQDAKRRTYHLRIVDRRDACVELLSKQPDVTDVQCQDSQVTFDYVVEDQAAADLLRLLIGAGIPVSAFGAVKKTLEDAYLSAGLKQVD